MSTSSTFLNDERTSSVSFLRALGVSSKLNIVADRAELVVSPVAEKLAISHSYAGRHPHTSSKHEHRHVQLQFFGSDLLLFAVVVLEDRSNEIRPTFPLCQALSNLHCTELAVVGRLLANLLR